MDLQAIERSMQEELDDLTARLRRQDAAGSVEATPADLYDAAQALEHREHQQLTAARLSERARRLSAALARLRAGEYGVCRECGGPIAPARLRAVPDADACVTCQERLERVGRPA
jgi:DnaK suppressor protein